MLIQILEYCYKTSVLEKELNKETITLLSNLLQELKTAVLAAWEWNLSMMSTSEWMLQELMEPFPIYSIEPR